MKMVVWMLFRHSSASLLDVFLNDHGIVQR